MKFRGLFLNTIKENCSIYESGLMVFNILQLESDDYTMDYLEINETKNLISLNYDFYIFNFHHSKMSWLDTSCIRTLIGKKYAIVLEVAPGNPFASINDKDFDGFMVLDPTISVNNAKVFTFVRPLELDIKVKDYVDHDVPIIGSFGFPTPGKGFELLVDAVNKEFNKAIVRINVPPVNEDTYKHYYKLYNIDYTTYLENLCKSIAKPYIELKFTKNYFNKAELINWCGANTLNCFMYNRFQTGLSATTDQAIVSGRPLAISSNETFRHIHKYIVPYPYRSLKDSIKYSSSEVASIKNEWTSQVFRNTFIKMLKNTKVKILNRNIETTTLMNTNVGIIRMSLMNRIGLKIKKEAKKVLNLNRVKNYTKYLFEKNRRLEIIERTDKMEDTILFVSHSSRQCGIYEFGWNLKEAYKSSKVYHFCYTECKNSEELAYSIKQTNPSVIIYNYYPATMPWLTRNIKEKYNIIQIGYIQEFDQTNIAEKIKSSFFDFCICPDPSIDLSGIDGCFKTGRLLAKYQNYINLPVITTVGSFGFGFPDKGFERIVEKVQNEFEEAIIRINMPFNDIVDPDGTKFALSTAARCRAILKNPRIELQITHNYLSKSDILDFLAANTINVFLYNSDKSQGVSSALDYALSVQRPVAISSANMFRHVRILSDGITIDRNSLKSIIQRGISPLVPLLNEWSEPQMIMTIEKILDRVLKK